MPHRGPWVSGPQEALGSSERRFQATPWPQAWSQAHNLHRGYKTPRVGLQGGEAVSCQVRGKSQGAATHPCACHKQLGSFGRTTGPQRGWPWSKHRGKPKPLCRWCCLTFRSLS